MRDNSIDMLMAVARVLNRLPQPVVYTGGATISLYLDALSARDMRPTDDVDCVVEVTSQREYYQLAAILRDLGLSEDTSPGAPLCRWLCAGVKLDVMPVDPQVLGFGNRWYQRGVAGSIEYILPNKTRLKSSRSPIYSHPRLKLLAVAVAINSTLGTPRQKIIPISPPVYGKC
jgi:hypothetical protein